MKKLFEELHERSLWQVLGIYLAGSWLVLQVVDQLTESAGLPEWVPSFALVLLLIGLPIVVATAVLQHRDRPAAGTGDLTAPAAARPADEDPAVAEAAIVHGASGGVPRRLFTWRNAILGGVGSAVVFLAVLGGWSYLRHEGIGAAGTLVAKGVIDDGERVILADFSGDSALAVAATMALRVQLAESGIVSVAEPSVVNEALRRMQAEEGPLDTRRARDVAEREGLAAIISGDVSGAGGSSYILTATVIETASGEALVTVGETATDQGEFLAAMDRLGRKLRERLGESLGSIRSSAPLERATTSSTEALRKYSRAREAFDDRDMEKAIALLDEAIALDSTFGMAWRALAVADPERRKEAATRAYELRERLTERERYHAVAIYQSYVLADDDETVTTYRALLEQYPDDATALNNLGVAYRDLGQLELAAEMYGRAVTVEPSSAHYYANLIPILYDLGQADSSRSVLETFAERFPDHPNVIRFRSQFAYVDGDAEAAEAALEPMLESEVMSQRRDASALVSNLRIRSGRLREGEQLWRESQEELAPLDEAMYRSRLEMDVVLDTTAARSRVLEALAAAPDSVVDDNAGRLAGFFYDIGDVGRGDEYWRRDLAVDSVQFANMPERFRPMLELGHASDVAFARGDYETALENYRELEKIWLRLSSGQDPATWSIRYVPVFEALGEADSVIARYETWLGRRDLGRFWADSRNLSRAHERLAQLYDQKGDLENAALHYAAFIELWQDADSELQPRVQAAQARLEEIVKERG